MEAAADIGPEVECAECAIPRRWTPPDVLWLADSRGEVYCRECLDVLELLGQLLARASGWLQEVEDELWN
ncbi:hypothetical protein [Qaidamihabitans albus]|uniref:hypothetical protein n=1 Tax=Qaidamihabitans albus TaxID=2795733 RepID=UPI0018F277FE|nr:hypothetical protein [Qaidamihabitans albus]